jgi:hypothetical protein
MDDSELTMALDRAERALERVQRALAGRQADRQGGSARDDALRARVREVVEELDELIREAAA